MSMLVTWAGEGKSALDADCQLTAVPETELSVWPSIIVPRSTIGFENRGAMFAGVNGADQRDPD